MAERNAPQRPSDSIDVAARVATLTAAAMLAQQVAGKAARDALFLSSFAVSSVPKAMVVSALLSAVGVLAFTRLLTRVGPTRGVPVVFFASAVLLVGEWALAAHDPRAAALAVYAHMGLFGATVTSGFWSLISERFDPHTAKRVVGKITAGGTLGSILGGLLAWRIAHAMDVRMMLLAMAGMNLLCVVGVMNVRGAPQVASDAARAPAKRSPSSVAVLRRTPYLRSLGLLVALGAVVQALLDYVLNAQAVATYGKGEGLLTFFAFFYMGTGVVSFLLQTSLTRRALESFGLAGTLAVLPGSLTVSFLMRVFLPPFWTAVMVRGVEATLRSSLYRAGYELLYTPLPQDEKRPTKTLVDVGFDRLGTLVGSGITMTLLYFFSPHGAEVTITAITIAVSALTFGLSRSLHKGYVAALEKSLRSGAVKLDARDVLDATTKRTWSETIEAFDRKKLLDEIALLREAQQHEREQAGDGSPRSRRSTMPSRSDAAWDAGPQDPIVQAIVDLRSNDALRIRRTLARPQAADRAIVPHVILLLADHDHDVSSDALRYLRAMAPRAPGPMLDALLDPETEPKIRRRLPRALAEARDERVAAGLVRALGDAELDVREQAARSLARMTGEVPALAPPSEAVFAVVQGELARGLSTWDAAARDADHDGAKDAAKDATGDAQSIFGPRAHARGTGRGLEHVFTLLSVVLEREPVKLAFLALGTEDRNLRGTALEYLEVVLPERIRTPLGRLLGGTTERPPRPRTRAQVVDDLLKSQHALRIDVEELRKKPPSIKKPD